MAGPEHNPMDDVPPDKEEYEAAMMVRERDNLIDALESCIKIIGETHDHWDADRDAKVGKYLAALGGHLPKYRADIDKIHETLRRAKQNRGAA